MSIPLTLLMISTLLLAGITGLLRYAKIGRTYAPFIIYLWVGILNEFISMYTSRVLRSTVLNNNIFMLAECLLLTWQFYEWSKFPYKKRRYAWIMVLFAGFFIVEAAIGGISVVVFYFNLCYASYVVLWSVHRLSFLIVTNHYPLRSNGSFVICCGFIFYFTSRIILEACWHFGLLKSVVFRNEIMWLMIWLNFFVNFLYFLALVWTRKKPSSITQSF